jgi:NAD-dependent SIR2 family protein deacetylase
LQRWLEQNNPDFASLAGTIAPDGDADIDELDYSSMKVPDCEYCGGILKPDAVFFGDSIPKQRVADAEAEMLGASGLLVVGSSLSTYSGYRFCLWAKQQNKPIVIINQGETRADEIACERTNQNCSSVLQVWLNQVS